MERPVRDAVPPDAVPPDAAREQLRAAREAHERSLRRATPPAGLILAMSVLCGALTVSPAYRGPGHVVSIVAVAWFVAELLRLSARNQWRALRELPRARWNVLEFALIAVAVAIGGFVGPHVLASRGESALASGGLGAAVAVSVAACLLAASTSYRRRNTRTWRS